MQGLRKGEWSAVTKVKVLSPEICLIASGQGFLHLEASSAARDNGECVSDVPGSESMAGHSKIHIGTWDSHIVLNSEASNELKRQRRKYGDMAVGLTHIRKYGTTGPAIVKGRHKPIKLMRQDGM
ncbi:MAG: hypothetical protein GY774_01190 [Planctomycetes bacterium]|nr:hypothetical protein [Planctomycetota bacterium]